MRTSCSPSRSPVAPCTWSRSSGLISTLHVRPARSQRVELAHVVVVMVGQQDVGGSHAQAPGRLKRRGHRITRVHEEAAAALAVGHEIGVREELGVKRALDDHLRGWCQGSSGNGLSDQGVASLGMLRACSGASPSLASIAVLAAIAGCGSSSSSTPAQFSANALGVCTKVAPRIKATTASVNTLNASSGSSLNKLPQLATLLDQLATELTDLHARALRGRAPSRAERRSSASSWPIWKQLEGLAKSGAGAPSRAARSPGCRSSSA